jgi:hypothetical protein
MSRSLYRYALAAAAGLLLLSARPAWAAQGPPPMPASFQVLLHRSIFSREPLRPGSGPTGPAVRLFESTGPSGPPVFIGAVRDETGSCVAFLEDPQTGKTAVVAVGQRLEQGTTRLGSVEQVTLDALVLRPTDGGPSRRIEVGQTLTGEARPDLTATAAADTTQPAGGASGSPAATDPREILRQRRLRELQGK